MTCVNPYFILNVVMVLRAVQNARSVPGFQTSIFQSFAPTFMSGQKQLVMNRRYCGSRVIALPAVNIKGVGELRLPDRSLLPALVPPLQNATRPHGFNTNRARLVFHIEHVAGDYLVMEWG